MDAKELKGFTLADLRKKTKELKEEYFQTKLQNVSGALENTAKIKALRRTLARVATVVSEKMGGR